MLRILFFLVPVFALGLGFAWLADRPGDIVVTFAGYQYRTTLMVAAVLIAAIVAATMLSWWLIKSLWNSPHAVARYFRVRRRDRGYQALSTGMIAAGAGDAALARTKKREAMKLISADREPLIHLLDAQASLLEGDYEVARAKFEAMLADPETRLLALRGLYLEAMRLGEREAARHYAARAVEVAPQLGWASAAMLEVKTQEGAWDEALRLVDAQKATKQIDRAKADRKKAVLLTAKAMELIDPDPAAAKAAALQAHRLAPELVPAALAAARAAFRLDNLKKGAKVLEASWKKQPHPEVADLYIHARHGDSTHDRLARAKKLRSLKLNNAESELAVVRAALDAGEFAEAREAAEAALRISPREGGYLVMADIEEAETGDQGRVREWLARAVRAPRDPAWVADGQVAPRWAPFSPLTGRLDAFEWRVPVERLGETVEPYEPLAIAAAQPEPEPTPAPPLPEAAAPEPAASPSPALVEEPALEPAAEPVAAASAEPAPAAPEPQAPQAGTVVPEPAIADAMPEEEPGGLPSRMPDDPGVEPREEDENDASKAGRFRLF